MTTWTDSATRALEQHLVKLRATLQTSGADAAEVGDDLRRHIEEEVRAGGLTVVNEEDVRRLLARAGFTEAAADTTPPPPQSPTPLRKRLLSVGDLTLLAFVGVVLPMVALGIELATHMCAAVFFDPLPTWWHLVLIASVPAVNAASLWVTRNRKVPFARWLWQLNGVTVAVALFYGILFLPLTPFAVVGTLYLGLGLIPLSPLLALLAGLRLRVQLRRLRPAEQAKAAGWWLPFGAAFLVLVALAAPKPITRHLEQLADSDSSAEAAGGIRRLRWLGSEDTLLRDCYGQSRRADDSLWFNWFAGRPVPADRARQLYYRVTGRAFNSVPPPQAKFRNRAWSFLDEFEWDEALGGDAVAGVVKGLSLIQSRLDATCNADEVWGYVEWTLEFQNDSGMQREARAQIALPPGAVVSRLTLWVDGEEREAAFAGRSQVKEAYRKVAVVQRRDPVLVTTCGPDRVMMQCFPIPPNGGKMKVRLGVTVSLRLEQLDAAVLEWPCFLERNFKLGENFTHTLWLQSPQAPATAPAVLKAEELRPGTHAIKGQLADRALARGDALVRLRRNAALKRVTTPENSTSDDRLVAQTFRLRPAAMPPRVVVVVDGSRLMQPFAREIADALATLRGKTEVVVMLARDDAADFYTTQDLDAATARLRGFRFNGGHDNVPALTRGWEQACEKPGGVLLWIHAQQPVILDPAEALRQSMEWRGDAGGSSIMELCVTAGPDRVAEKLDGLKSFSTLPRAGTPGERLRQLFARWRGDVPVIEAVREAVRGTADKDTHSASKHIARLWAKEEIALLAAQRKTREATALAGAYQLVTTVSGAVVLETAAQYKQTGLNPVDPETVPAVPEPSIWSLMAAGLTLFLIWRRVHFRGASAQLRPDSKSGR